MTDFSYQKPLFEIKASVDGNNANIFLLPDKIQWIYLCRPNKVNEMLLDKIVTLSNRNDFYMKKRTISRIDVLKENASFNNGLMLVIYSVVPRIKDNQQLNILATTVLFNSLEELLKTHVRITELMENNISRPKTLLVFINPIGGFKEGVKRFYEKVEPIFMLAGINYHVIVTQRRNEAKDFILSKDDLKVDGLVCVGGDGMVMEIVTGLLLNSRKCLGYSEDQHSCDSPEIRSNLRVGIIPAGSTDSIAFSTIGTKDSITAALHIVLGSSVNLDTAVVYKKNKFMKYNLTLMGYGFYGNIIAQSECLRWMGPKRYDWLGFKTFLNMDSYYGELRYLPAPICFGSPNDGVMCTQRCTRCDQISNDNSKSPGSETDSEEKWITIRDRFVAINSFLISCRCKKSPIGPAPFCHLGNGFADLVIVKNCSKLKFLQHLMRTASYDDRFNFEFIETVRVKEFSFTPLSGDGNDVSRIQSRNRNHNRVSVWNCDGEPVHSAAVHLKYNLTFIVSVYRFVYMTKSA